MNISTKTFDDLPLFDSNILVFAHNTASPYHRKAKELLFSVISTDSSAALSPQNILEFYSIITSPKRVDKPLVAKDAIFLSKEYLESGAFVLIYPQETTVKRAFELAESHGIKKVDIFDTFLAVTMLDNGITTIYTDNEKHFKIFKEIKVVNPFK